MTGFGNTHIYFYSLKNDKNENFKDKVMFQIKTGDWTYTYIISSWPETFGEYQKDIYFLICLSSQGWGEWERRRVWQHTFPILKEWVWKLKKKKNKNAERKRERERNTQKLDDKVNKQKTKALFTWHNLQSLKN